MVTDVIANAALYERLGEGIRRGLAFIARPDLGSLAAGRHDIDGDALFALVQDYPTKAETEGRWEAHRRYIDLQFVAAGIERIGVAPVGTLSAGDYDETKDITWMTGSGDFVTMPAGRFMILWPSDAHMPGLTASVLCRVRKVVVKIAVS